MFALDFQEIDTQISCQRCVLGAHFMGGDFNVLVGIIGSRILLAYDSPDAPDQGYWARPFPARTAPHTCAAAAPGRRDGPTDHKW